MKITITNVSKTYEIKKGFIKKKIQKVEALRNINLNIERGIIFSLLGPNGAGKTTLIKIISSLLLPDKGDVFIDNISVLKDFKAIQKKIGVVLTGERSVYWKLTVFENLEFFGSLYGLSSKEIKVNAHKLLKYFNLYEKKDSLVETLSSGMRRKTIICKALIHNPDILILDEPTIGLDPKSAIDLRNLIVSLKNLGKTIILTTHYMFEADMLSDEIAIINKGRIIAKGTADQLKSYVKNTKKIQVELNNIFNNSDLDIGKLKNYIKESYKRLFNNYVKISINDKGNPLFEFNFKNNISDEKILKFIYEKFANFNITISIKEPTLEDAFIYLTKDKT